MVLASLLVAVLALAIAVASAVYTRRQATASEGVLAIEQSRRLEERRPTLTGKVERVGNGLTRLVVTLTSNEALVAMEVSIPDGQGVTFDRNVYGVHPVRPGNPALSAFAYDLSGEPTGMEPRGSMIWKVELAQEHVNSLQLEASCHGMAGERWDSVMIAAPVEPDISKTVW
jgi:hypothetical protein